MGMNRKTGRGAKFLIVFVVIVIIMAAVTFFAGKYAYHLLREYIEYASKQSTEVVLEKDGLIEWMSEKEKEKLPKKFLVSDIEAELWKNGEVYDFAFNIQEFDESDEYMKDIYYRYDSREGKLSKTENVNEVFPTEYDPNAEVDYLDSQIKMTASRCGCSDRRKRRKRIFRADTERISAGSRRGKRRKFAGCDLSD